MVATETEVVSKWAVRILLEWNAFLCIFTANEVWGKVIFSQACAIPSVQRGGGAWLPSMHHRSHDQSLHPGWLGRSLQPLQDTVNKRAVRILLECILVLICGCKGQI